MAESRLLVVATGLGHTEFDAACPRGLRLGATTAVDLAAVFLKDLESTAQSLLSRSGIQFRVASPDEPLARVFEDGFSAGFDSICVIGTSAPHLPASYILEAFGRLTQHRKSTVVGPTTTGGCYLIGASSPPPYSLLKELRPQAPNVLTETLQRALASELSIALLPSISVIETSVHLKQLSGDFRRGVTVAPNTQYILRKLELE
jgi:glycosyltransferase A (GT-A) superfamily protein (DUF2064 family)